MDLISDAEWALFRQSMRDAHDTFAQKPITWVRYEEAIDQFEEGNWTKTSVELKGLCNYNVLRTWPINYTTETGEYERQTIQIYLYKQYLADSGYIHDEGYFIYNPTTDRFIIDGLEYRPSGDTPVSQADAEDQWITIILQREETSTGDNR